MQTIGERLEEARKKKGISIREAAEATKIRSDYLQKFESNHFDIGLTEIYTRGFLRTYANFLKLPSDRILNDYAALGRGDTRSSSRQPNREVYGRLDVTTATTSEPADRASSSDEAAPTAEARTARTGRTRAPASLPTGPDPAVVYRYVKWGGIAVVAIVLLLVIKSLFSGSGSTPPRTATTPPATAPQTTTAPSPTQVATNPDQSITLIALDVVFVTVTRRNADDSDGEEIFKGMLSKGERRSVPKLGPLYIATTEAQNLKIGFRGNEHVIKLNGEAVRGYQRFKMD